MEVWGLKTCYNPKLDMSHIRITHRPRNDVPRLGAETTQHHHYWSDWSGWSQWSAIGAKFPSTSWGLSFARWHRPKTKKKPPEPTGAPGV